MADKKKGNAFTNNPLVKAVGTQKIVVLLVIIVLFAFFSIMSPGFRKYPTLVSIFDYSYYISFMAIGVTFCLITGGVDLSIGTGMICYALFGGYLITRQGMPVLVGILGTILMGVIMGCFQRCAGGSSGASAVHRYSGNHDGSQRFRFHHHRRYERDLAGSFQ